MSIGSVPSPWWAATLSIPILVSQLAPPPRPAPATTPTRVVLLGTGTPQPNPDRSGPATAIVVNDTAYLVYNSLSSDELQADMMSRYAGHFVIGRDLDVY